MPAKKKPAHEPPALRITLPGGSCVVGSRESLAKILELTLFRPVRAPAPAPVRARGTTARTACRRAA